MEGFGYICVMVSILLGMGLTRLLAGIGNLVQIRRRVKLYWLHTLWVLLVIVFHLHVWWSFWTMRGVTVWNYATFVFVLLGPATLVIASRIIIPELIGDRIVVERHYYDTSPLFFGILSLGAAWFMFLEPVMGVRSFFVPIRFLQASGVVTFACCAASKDRRLHVTALVVIAALLAVSITLARFSLGQHDL
jgi:hypothetical protein